MFENQLVMLAGGANFVYLCIVVDDGHRHKV